MGNELFSPIDIWKVEVVGEQDLFFVEDPFLFPVSPGLRPPAGEQPRSNTLRPPPPPLATGRDACKEKGGRGERRRRGFVCVGRRRRKRGRRGYSS